MNLFESTRTQVNDMFSQFSRFIAPMYYHDRCERTLQMYVYIIHKREILLSLLTLLSAYILFLFFGIAGPNVEKITSITAQRMFDDSRINSSYRPQLLTSGPFVITTSSMSSYSQQLSLYITFSLKNEESSEAFHKDFDVKIDLLGLRQKSNSSLIKSGKQVLSLYCGGRQCDPVRVMRLMQIEYEHYRVNVTFARLETVYQKYEIVDIQFEFSSVNVSFTTLSIWFRFFFLFVTFCVMLFYMHHLYRFPVVDWSLEQKWTAMHLILLILSNNPFYPIQFLLGSTFPRLLEVWLHTTLQTVVMLFWLCFFHGIRQSNRSLCTFYANKLVIVGTLWLTATYTISWSLNHQLTDPIFNETQAFSESTLLQVLSLLFYVSFFVYFVQLTILVFAAFTELRSMPYFDVRLKLQTFLMLFVITISMLTILLNYSANSSSSSCFRASSIAFLQLLPFTHFSSSSATFLSIFSLVNIYICSCAYYYRPSINQLNENYILRDNPNLSMVNDSDSDVLYGSDTEKLLDMSMPMSNMVNLLDGDEENIKLEAMPMQSRASFIPNLIDTRTDEESD